MGGAWRLSVMVRGRGPREETAERIPRAAIAQGSSEHRWSFVDLALWTRESCTVKLHSFYKKKTNRNYTQSKKYKYYI